LNEVDDAGADRDVVAVRQMEDGQELVIGEQSQRPPRQELQGLRMELVDGEMGASLEGIDDVVPGLPGIERR
jgi:hypothetical protein